MRTVADLIKFLSEIEDQDKPVFINAQADGWVFAEPILAYKETEDEVIFYI
jgi:hypothetical protein